MTILPEPVEAWNSNTHEWIMKQISTILNNEGHEEAANFVDTYLGDLILGVKDADTCAWDSSGNMKTYEFKYTLEGIPPERYYVDSDSAIPCDACLQGDPCEYQTTPLRGICQMLMPYYQTYGVRNWFAVLDQYQEGFSKETVIPGTGPSLSCSNIQTAGEMATDYFNLALQKWQANSPIEAARWLGRACHMLQDVLTVYHSKVNLLDLLGAGEFYYRAANNAQETQDSYAVTDGKLWDYDNNWSPFTWVGHCSEYSLQYWEYMDGKYTDLDWNDWEGFVKNDLLHASQWSTAEFVEYFWRTKDQSERFPLEVKVHHNLGQYVVTSGQGVNVDWTVTGGTQQTAELYYSNPTPIKGIDRGGWEHIETLDPDEYIYTWTAVEVDEPMVSRFMVKVRGESDDGISTDECVVGYSPWFLINPVSGGPTPSVEVSVGSVTSPTPWNQPETVVEANNYCFIDWTARAELGIDHVDIVYIASFTEYGPVAIFPNTGHFRWLVPSELENEDITFLILAYDKVGHTALAVSSTVTIVEQMDAPEDVLTLSYVGITSPQGGEVWGGVHDIKWGASSAHGYPSLFDVFLEKDLPGAKPIVLASFYADSQWQQDPSLGYSLRVDFSDIPAESTRYMVRIVKTGVGMPPDYAECGCLPFDIFGVVEVDSTKSGQNFWVDIEASSVSNLWAWQGGMTFDPTVLQCMSFEEGPFLASGGATVWRPGMIDNTNGVITPFYCTLTDKAVNKPVNGSGILAKLTFKAVTQENSTIHLMNVNLCDPLNQTILIDTITDGYFTLSNDVKVKYVTVPYREVYPGWSTKAIISNVGNYEETINVTTYLNDTIIGECVVILDPGSDGEITVFFPEDMPLYANYVLRVEVTPVSGETILGDNLYIYGPLIMKMTGDVNCDRKINIIDIGVVAKAFGTEPGDPRWDPICNINGDFDINIVDIAIVAKEFGKTY